MACAALAWFRQFYRWERQWKDVSDDERYALRQQHAVPLLAEFHDWLVKTEPHVLPKSKIGEAVSYASISGNRGRGIVMRGFFPSITTWPNRR